VPASASEICTCNEWVAQSVMRRSPKLLLLHEEALESHLVKNVAEIGDFQRFDVDPLHPVELDVRVFAAKLRQAEVRPGGEARIPGAGVGDVPRLRDCRIDCSAAGVGVQLVDCVQCSLELLHHFAHQWPRLRVEVRAPQSEARHLEQDHGVERRGAQVHVQQLVELLRLQFQTDL
jgi:hypothetical protein